MKNKNKFIFCSLVLLVYFLLFILKPIYQYISFSKMDVNSSMVQWIQDKSDQDWHALDEHIHLVTSKENGHNIGLIYVVETIVKLKVRFPLRIRRYPSVIIIDYKETSVLKLVGWMERNGFVMLGDIWN